MPENFEIKKFITANRAEVKDMCLTEYNEMETMEMFREEGLQEGLQKGLQKGLQEGLLKGKLLDIQNLIDSTGWDTDQVMDMLKIPPDQQKVLSFKLTKN